ncbi:LysR family transcriptional regulator [uncultured Vagococcus sp.]|uniref:LysR family transcriptional regulator n=1 Tax=uncultured Vagococcus sp. TaxID=189676 RepID=UPI00258B6DCB|nr:LysR family transcriptional regulator [uncultured Vagococcus sp.]
MFKLLATFRVAYETRNFSKAAEVLFISQPAVSNQIKQLEEELQCVLFKRKGKQEMHPTKSADILYGKVLNLRDDWVETVRLVKESDNQQILCRISASHTVSVYYMPELMRYLINEFPKVIFEVDMKNSEEVLQEIHQHNVDFGFIEMPLMTDGISRLEIKKDQLVLAGNLQSNLWLSREANSGVYHYMERYLLSENLKPNRVIIKNNEIIIKMLEKGIGKSMISKQAVPDSLPYVDLGKDYVRPLYFLKKNNLIQRDLQEIAEAIEKFYK